MHTSSVNQAAENSEPTMKTCLRWIRQCEKHLFLHLILIIHTAYYMNRECLALHLVLVLERKAEISNHLIQHPSPSTMTETPCYTELSEMTIESPLEFFPSSPAPRE
jgi:hypothetical protein